MRNRRRAQRTCGLADCPHGIGLEEVARPKGSGPRNPPEALPEYFRSMIIFFHAVEIPPVPWRFSLDGEGAADDGWRAGEGGRHASGLAATLKINKVFSANA